MNVAHGGDQTGYAVRLIVRVSFFARIGSGRIHKGHDGQHSSRAVLGKFYCHQVVLRHPTAQLCRAILRNEADLTALSAAKVHFQHGLIVWAAAFSSSMRPS